MFDDNEDTEWIMDLCAICSEPIFREDDSEQGVHVECALGEMEGDD